MLYKKRVLWAVLASSLVSGCSWFGGDFFRDRSGDYRSADSTPPLEIPAGLDNNAINNYYPIPDIGPTAPLGESFEVPRPLSLAGNREDSIKIKSLDGQRWILASMAPGQVWPRLRDFLLIRRIGLATENGVTGVIDTNWLTKADDDPFREKYRIEVKQGLQRNSTEVYVLQYEEEKSGQPSRAVWGTKSVNPEREKLVLDEFARYLADTIDATSSVSLKAQGIDTSRRMYLAGGQNPELRFDLAFDRGWAATNFALEKAAFTVNDMDASKGIYYVTYSGPIDEFAEEEGFWGMINPFSGDDGIDWETTDYRIIITQDDKDGWLELQVQKDDEQEEGEFEFILNEIQGYMS